MARKSRQTVDYFPHMCKHGRSLRVIESHYENDGYSLWFKLLECIGASDGHVYDCKDVDNWEYLLAYAHLAEDKALEIMAKFAKLGMIDKNLWENCRLAWSDNFVAGLKDVYDKRIVDVPKKPVITKSSDISGPEINSSEPIRPGYPQRNLSNLTELKEPNVTQGNAENSSSKENGKVPTPDEAYNEVIKKGGNTTEVPSYSHHVVGWAAQKFGGSAELARKPEKEAAYFRESYVTEYVRLCESLGLKY